MACLIVGNNTHGQGDDEWNIDCQATTDSSVDEGLISNLPDYNAVSLHLPLTCVYGIILTNA